VRFSAVPHEDGRENGAANTRITTSAAEMVLGPAFQAARPNSREPAGWAMKQVVSPRTHSPAIRASAPQLPPDYYGDTIAP